MQRLIPLFWSIPAFVLAYISGLYLFSSTAFSNLVTVIINIGLDPLRAQLVCALVMTIGAAVIGACLGRRRLAALLGASLVFLSNYLANFITTQTQPVRNPGGLIEPLNSTTLVHTSVIMVGLGIACAFVGMAIGAALGEVLLDPLYQLYRYTWRRLIVWLPMSKQRLYTIVSTPTPRLGRPLALATKWIGVALVIVLFVLVSQSSDLFLFSPDVGLHALPIVHSIATGLPSHGTVKQGSFTSSALHGQRKNFMVYLPPSYNTPLGRNKYYPTLYLLHGSPGTDIDWVKGGKATASADTLIDTHRMPETIIIMPDGNGRAKETSEWGNSGDQRQLIENYVAYDLVNYVDQHYRTLPDTGDRAIGGLSMGGFGAMNIAIHHPNVFGSVISLGGYYRAAEMIWGNNPTYRAMNSPLYTLPNTPAAWKLHIYLGAATKDQPYYTDTRQFAQELDRLHIPYHFDLEHGYHAWHIWEVQMYKALSWIPWEATTNNNKLKTNPHNKIVSFAPPVKF
ncbi:MAG TPA: alpha/beta hydrolase-fold protein [Ktedonobacteraceae bacterium]|nr:alpha/beta hydrolase-fold protein [Ktedonobacteraceae bacterium]